MDLPKELGGLNIRRTEVLNQDLLAKLSWRMIEQHDAPWTKILRGYKQLELCQNTVSDISKIRIPMHGCDKMRWRPAANGVFSMKTSYEVFLDDQLRINPTKNNLSINWKAFWKLKLPPRIQHFMWKCLHTCVHVKERLARFSKHQDISCVMCGNGVETLHHLFVDCDVARRIWTCVSSPIHVNFGNLNFHNWLCGVFDIQNVNLQVNEALIIWTVKSDLSELTSSNVTNQLGSSISTVVVPKWKCECNGMRGRTMISLDPEQAGTKVLLEVVLWAKEMGKRRIHLEGDCVNILNALNGNNLAVRWTTFNLIYYALVILIDFEFWCCSNVHRDANHIADSSAKYVRSENSNFNWIENSPSWVLNLTQHDKNYL
ncbi:uncharacterized protein LOC113271916 [Papaver somniferum]|uniref:uncharacterized protein LOC113271916 n=1 Tax=Papaver somniferum TaxID=3469 RepID=UPI000E6FD292|nr:uncharacterized protein LOC113271916 [Papaver somniferum]